MNRAKIHSRVLAYLDTHHKHRYPVNWLRICFASDMLDCHGDEYIIWLFEQDDKAQWLDAIQTTERFVDERAKKAIEAHKQKSASWQVAK